MRLTPMQIFITILMVALGTMITRFLPFILFSNPKRKTAYIHYLGQVLPYAATSLLVIYCLKGIRFDSVASWLPESIAIIYIVLIHTWKENVLLSIGTGTLLYMLLVQYVFI
ncbi:AzlD domain-containing protein [Vallitaleaceae bacterium 9-2]